MRAIASWSWETAPWWVPNSHRGGVWTANADGSQLQQVTHTAVGEYNPRFRPGGRIEYSRWDAASSAENVYLVNPDGSGEVALTGGRFVFYSYAFSPDGSQLAWGGGLRFDGPSFIYTMTADGGSLTAHAPLSLRNSGGGAEVAWSRDGTALAYVSEDPAYGGAANIFRVGLAGGDPFDVTKRNIPGARNPDWIGPAAPVAGAAAARSDRVAPFVRLVNYRSNNDGLVTAHATQLGYIAIDRSGIRSVTVAVTRRVRSRATCASAASTRSRRGCAGWAPAATRSAGGLAMFAATQRRDPASSACACLCRDPRLVSIETRSGEPCRSPTAAG